jgi:predicted transcriptional regulator
LEILWELGSATVKDIHDRILADPNRELAYASVTTVLRRLTQKGWLACDKCDRAFRWHPLVSPEEAKILQAHDRLQHFLAISNPDMVAAFADALDGASVDKLEAIAQRLKAARQARENL